MAKENNPSRRQAMGAINEAVSFLHEPTKLVCAAWAINVEDYAQAITCCDQAIEELQKAKAHLADAQEYKYGGIDQEFEAAVQLLSYKVKSVGIKANGSYGQWKDGVESAGTPVEYFQVEGDDNKAGIPYFVSPNLEAIRLRAIEILRSKFYGDTRRFVRSVLERKKREAQTESSDNGA